MSRIFQLNMFSKILILSTLLISQNMIVATVSPGDRELAQESSWDIAHPPDDLDGMLLEAIRDGKWDLARFLVSVGANPNSDLTMEAFLNAARGGLNDEIIEFVQLGTNIDGLKQSPLSVAAENDQFNTVMLLVQLGANPSGNGSDRLTPICMIVYGPKTTNRSIRSTHERSELGCVRALRLAGAYIPDWNGGPVNAEVYAENRRFMDTENAFYAYIDAGDDFFEAGEEFIIEKLHDIISASFRTRRGEPEWNRAVLSLAFNLRQRDSLLRDNGRVTDSVLWRDSVAPMILDGEWTPERVSGARRFVAALASMGLLLSQLDHVANELIFNADTLPEIISSSEVRKPTNFGFSASERENLIKTESKVVSAMIPFVGITRTISFVRQFYAKRLALITTLKRRGFPEGVVERIIEFMFGEKDGIAHDLRVSHIDQVARLRR